MLPLFHIGWVSVLSLVALEFWHWGGTSGHVAFICFGELQFAPTTSHALASVGNSLVRALALGEHFALSGSKSCLSPIEGCMSGSATLVAQ